MTELRPRFAAPVVLLAALVAACSSAGPSASPGASVNPTDASTPTAAADGIQHPTGPADVILRMESGGGFVPMDFFATSAPSFTLYGDGTVVFRDPAGIPPSSADGLDRSIPFQVVHLSEDGIQALLAFAIGPGGLGTAIGPYVGLGADIPTTTFAIATDGRTKTVSVVGLSPDMHPQNALIVSALDRLGQRLDGFGTEVGGEQPYVPSAYRGVLAKIDQAFGPVVAWPWTEIGPEDFVAGQNTFRLVHTLAPADVAALGIPNVAGGFQGLSLQSGATLYSFALRPLLPDETS